MSVSFRVSGITGTVVHHEVHVAVIGTFYCENYQALTLKMNSAFSIIRILWSSVSFL